MNGIKIEVEMRFGLVTSTHGEWFSLSLKDRASSTTFCEVKIEKDQVAYLMANRMLSGIAECFNLDRVGLLQESKNVVLVFKKDPSYYEEGFVEELDRAALLYERQNSGWIVDRYVNSKWYKYSSKEYSTTARRWIPKPKTGGDNV